MRKRNLSRVCTSRGMGAAFQGAKAAKRLKKSPKRWNRRGSNARLSKTGRVSARGGEWGNEEGVKCVWTFVSELPGVPAECSNY
jgi:hypothetical protein